MFCPKCSSILKPTNKGKICSCGYVEEGDDVIKEKVINTNKEIQIIDQVNQQATANHTCEKCGYKKAQLILTISGGKDDIWGGTDEDQVFYICGKCGHREKD